ncbi:MAG TPA: PAS domain S-box protein, partial [Planctomycetota bacterium]|nr:PAS domain S-box protein [Planctomycetota bacterium]
MNDRDERELQSTAFQNAKSILQAQQRAEAELLRAKDALEARANELAQAVSTLRATLESTADAILVTGAHGEVLDCNDKLGKLWHVPCSSFIGLSRQKLWEAIGGQLADGESFKALLESDKSAEESSMHLHLDDGRVLECQSNAKVVDGAIVGRVWSFRDITELQRSETRKRESAQRLELAIAAGNLGDWSWDAATDTVTLGARAAAILGISAAQGTNVRALRDLLHPDDKERAHQAVMQSVRERTPYDVEYRWKRPDGEEVWIAVKGQGIYAFDGTLLGMLGVAQDVTERRTLDLLQHRMAAIVESSDDAIVSKDLDGTLRTWNSGAERIFGYTAAETVGRSIMMLIPPELQGEEHQILGRLRRGERVDHYETVRLTKDGRRIDLSLTVSPIRDSTGRIVGASKVARDITARKRVEAELRRSEEELRKAAQERQFLLEAERTARAEAERVSFMKDEFLATLSHELRTPLNAIVGWSQVLRSRTTLDTEAMEGLSIIDRNAKLQAQLIEDLLDMSRINSGKVRLDVERVDILDIVKAAIASVRHAADSKGLELHGALDPYVGPVWGDPRRLQQCVSNLLSNAIKFTPRSGRIEVTLARIGSNVGITVA